MVLSDPAAKGRPLHPARLVIAGFAGLISIGTLLLWLPISSTADADTSILDALFTATSAVCVTGLSVVDTGSHWTLFGTVVIMVLIQIGGFGIMTLGTLAGLLLSRQLGLRQRSTALAERGASSLGEIKALIKAVAIITVVVEIIAAISLGFGFWRSTDLSFIRSMAYGVFHAISAFNHAGFALFSDNLEGFVANWWISGTVALTVILSSLGFPVIVELLERRRERGHWSLHTRIVLVTTAVLLAAGAIFITVFEWNNPATLGNLGIADRLLAGGFASAMPRTAGFNSLPIGSMNDATLLVTDGLMFIGTAPASPGGGIKLTTFALLAFVMLAELQGEPDVTVFERKVPGSAQRRAVTIALAAVGVVISATLVILESSNVTLSAALFESISAFATVGLSTGITADLGTTAKLTLIALMFLGRVGPLTLGTALVLRSRKRRYRLPEEGILIG